MLIIVNTINKGIELYKQLKKYGFENINLLHSRFEQVDRKEKEQEIKKFSNKCNSNGIWITTQIVEASLDIDFDMLYTEMSTLDSLFQRLGRCFRNREYNSTEPNVKIYVEKISGVGYIYDKEIYHKSLEILRTFDGQVLSEKEKINLVDKLYSKENLNGTEFYNKFKQSFQILNNIIDYEVSKKEAQKILRNIETIQVIPQCVYEENRKLFDDFKNEKDFKQKYLLKRKIDDLFISINASNRWKLSKYIVECARYKRKIHNR